MKKHIYKIISIIMLVPFFFVSSVPVFADYDVDMYTVDTWQVLAYEYWNKLGFNYTQSFTNSTNIAVPQYTFTTGNTGQSLICNGDSSYPANGYACYYRNNSTGQVYGTWMQNTSNAHTEVEQNISLQGAEIPWLHGTYIHDTAYNSNARAVFLPGNGDLYISFITTVNTFNGTNYDASAVQANPHVMVYSQDTVQYYIDFEVVSSSQINGCYWLTFKFHNNDSGRHWLNINFPRLGTGNNETKIIPYYVGSGNDLSDAQKQSLNIQTSTELKLSEIDASIDSIYSTVVNTNLWVQSIANQGSTTNQYLSTGNSTSQAANTALNSENQQLTNVVNQVNSIETTYNSDLNSALNGIDLDNDLVSHTGFTNAALWVSAQFNRLIVGTPFELVMMFSLVTGLALVLIGKMRA